jgi:hypothetical protein
LRDPGIGLNEVLVLEPSDEGTTVQPVSGIQEARQLLQGGLTLADVVIPRTGPAHVEQLTRFEK